ncbi:hypothetical protein GCM10017691_01570 [Pseudonocardia petroleophila]|uniref:Uncharacterized protein n=1 Tax=Pseudonocardia petroleophila TaxID=37331 RepID=A0A7G7ML92_9PSEU|nr:hypothetical protein [Pseudonocardia petroleophila]QNG53553.1 hypothetical protein H6H00_06205 [Pseudonocardia petroleophila]
MTDDDRMAALFSEAASETPPPAGFDHARVVATSRRITARRRSAVLGGAMALLVVTGVGVAVALPGPGGDASSTAAAPAAAPGAASDAEARAEAAQAPDALRGPSEFSGTPLGPGTTECAQRQDPALRAYLEEVLPEVVGATEGAVTMDCRPGGERGVSLEVDDAGTAGLLSVEYLPPGEAPGPVSGTSASAPTASGGTVVVSSRGDGPGAPVPFAGRLDAAAAYLAPRL